VIAAVAAACCIAASVLFLGAAIGWRGAVRGLRDAPTTHDVAAEARDAVSVRAKALALTGLGAAVGSVLAGPPGLVGGGLAAGAIPLALDRRRVARRVQRIEEQMIDSVTAIASALRSGRSLVQSLTVAGEEVGAPLGRILEEAAGRARLGVPVDEVLEDLSARIGGPDARLVTGVLRLHRRTGGALAASLDDLARTLRARRDGARELRSLTAQARLSAAILGLLPFGFFLFMSVVARRDVESAYRTTAGASAIGVGLALQGAAFVWIRRILRVEAA